MSLRMYFRNFFKKIFDKLGFNQYSLSSDSLFKKNRFKESVMSLQSKKENTQNPPKSKSLFDEEFYKKFGTVAEAEAYIKNNPGFMSSDPKEREKRRKELIRKVWYSSES